MISTAMAMVTDECQSPVANSHPRKLSRASRMDDRRVQRRGAVRQPPVAGAATLGRLHHADHLRQKGVLGPRRGPNRQRPREVHHACLDHFPGAAFRRADSPETREQSSSDRPWSTTPSTGMRSPAATSTADPGSISDTGT